MEFKKTVLDHCKELKYLNTETKTSTPVYWGMDLTKKERDERRKLVEEMKTRKSNGEKDSAIRNGRIVTLTQEMDYSATQSLAKIIEKINKNKIVVYVPAVLFLFCVYLFLCVFTVLLLLFIFDCIRMLMTGSSIFTVATLYKFNFQYISMAECQLDPDYVPVK